MNSSDGTFPPPSGPGWVVKRHQPWWIKFGLLPLGVIVGIGALVMASNHSDDTGNDHSNRKMTLTEAVCDMLNDGDSAEDAYGAAKILAADHPLVYGEDESLAARAAVYSAQGQGCG